MIRHLLIFSLAALAACSSNSNTETAQSTGAATDTALAEQHFFPVTTYLEGQVFDIRAKGLTPVKYTTIKNRTDSVMIKLDELDELVKEFLQPKIDSTNLLPFYTESKFMDRTINAFTFTYEPIQPLADSLPLLHWDVYVDPENSQVKRVYIIKKGKDGKTLQLTWLSNKWFKTTTLVSKSDGSTAVEKEEKIVWDY
jgi:hypothetical protein